jgi:hypothetical protein
MRVFDDVHHHSVANHPANVAQILPGRFAGVAEGDHTSRAA